MGDWGSLPPETQTTFFREHMAGEDELVEALLPFEVVVAMRERTPFTSSLLSRLGRLRLVVTTGTSNRSIDMQAAAEQGVLVCGTGPTPASTIELAWALILALARHVPLEDAAVRRGTWQTTVGFDLRGSTLGLLGLGKLGSAMVPIAKAFGMSVIAWSPNLLSERASGLGVVGVDKDALFSQSDVLSIHMVLSDRTRGLVGEREISLMKREAFLVNTSRGPIVDEQALVHALETSSIAGAGLDVFDQEPLPADHPLARLHNTVLTPHVGFVTTNVYRSFFRDVVEDIAAFLAKRPVRVLNAP